jgi:hypothetical protein
MQNQAYENGNRRDHVDKKGARLRLQSGGVADRLLLATLILFIGVNCCPP